MKGETVHTKSACTWMFPADDQHILMLNPRINNDQLTVQVLQILAAWLLKVALEMNQMLNQLSKPQNHIWLWWAISKPYTIPSPEQPRNHDAFAPHLFARILHERLLYPLHWNPNFPFRSLIQQQPSIKVIERGGLIFLSNRIIFQARSFTITSML